MDMPCPRVANGWPMAVAMAWSTGFCGHRCFFLLFFCGHRCGAMVANFAATGAGEGFAFVFLLKLSAKRGLGWAGAWPCSAPLNVANCTWLAMADWPWLARADWPWLAVAGHGWPRLDVAGRGRREG